MGATEEEEGLAELLGFRAGFLLMHRFPLGALWDSVIIQYEVAFSVRNLTENTESPKS